MTAQAAPPPTRPATRHPISRALSLGAVLVVTAAAAWWSWPHPDLVLEVARGGIGTVVDRFGRHTPLPDTLFLQARGRETTVRIVNRDTARATLGIFPSAPGEVRDFTITTPGVYGGFCSAHPTRQRLTYVVR